MSPLVVGVAGAGPWATSFSVPAVRGCPEARLGGLWARRRDAAASAAGGDEGLVAASYDELLERCDAVALAVPPGVQAELAVRAAEAGRHLLLEKPLALGLPGAERLADAVARSGVATVVGLRHRLDPAIADLAAWSAATGARGAAVRMVSAAALAGSDFATPWRVEHGALLDLGPHALDLLEAVLGPASRVRVTGDPRRWVALTTEHPDGRVGTASLSLTVPTPPGPERLEVVTDAGARAWEGPGLPLSESGPALVAELVARVAGTPRLPGLDAAHALRLQRLLQAGATADRAAAD